MRQAFLLTIPRQQIVDAIVKPINPSAKLLDSQIWLPNQSRLRDDGQASNGSDAYSKVDIAKAKALLASAGVPAPSVKSSTTRRTPTASTSSRPSRPRLPGRLQGHRRR